MKKIFISLALILSSVNSTQANDLIQNANEITYEWLTDNNLGGGYTDHVSHFKRIFSQYKVRTFFEFGLGYSTKYFLDQCEKVISVEFVTLGYGPEWLQKTMRLYRDRTNWIPISYFTGYQGNTHWASYKYMGSDSVYNAAAHQCLTHQSYTSIDRHYLTELNDFIQSLVELHPIDIVFVDSALMIRGELVQLLFGKIPVIVAHDTKFRADTVIDDPYGYTRIITPKNYEEIYIPKGLGTTVWIIKKDEFKTLAQDIKAYAKEV
jgi:hypothetical protein